MRRQGNEAPLVTPHRVLTDNGIDPAEYPFSTAVLVFMPVGFIARLFDGEPPGKRIFGMVNKCLVRPDHGGTLLMGPVYGSPVCASALEELSALGVKHVVGFGLSGSLVPEIVPGDLMIASSGLASDGTTKEYTDDDEIGPDPELLTLTQDIFQKHGLKPKTGKVWTTDAIYREYPSKVSFWREKGASYVNMETSAFYAVAREVGIRSVYLSLVSDHVGGEEWTGWPADPSEGLTQLWNVCRDIIAEVGKKGRNNG
ncbi:MAG: hypothetical protein PHV74_03345 [Dehalococcoidia bacterium]|nr:hypothetical protein [Dehalococcoidia bacterium]